MTDAMERDDGFLNTRISYIQNRIAKNLTTLFNHWLKDGGLPFPHVTSKNFFIFKNLTGKKAASIDELRPISVTSIFFKMLEVILKKRIEDSTKGLRIAKLNETQFGFRPKLGTEPQILKMLYECNREKENNGGGL